jgi:AcrR family transcriptional regulator
MQKRKQSSVPVFEGAVRSAAQFDALASPVRDQIVQVLVHLAPWRPDRPEPEGVSIAEVARELGRKPASLYRHFDDLLAVGLIRETGVQASGGRDARTFSAIGEVMTLITPTRSGPALDALCRYLERMATHAGRESAAAVRERARQCSRDRDQPEQTPPQQASVSMFGWLTEDERVDLHGLLVRVSDIFHGATRRPGTTLVAASMLVRPVRLPGGATAEEADA